MKVNRSTTRSKLLRSFIEFLERELGFTFDLDEFNSRLTLQKLVFIAQEIFGLRLGYDFSIYLRGPYSRDLAYDYYHLPSESADLPLFDREGFLNLVRGKSMRWLEIASTVVAIYKATGDLEWAITRTSKLKAVKEEEVRKIAEELRYLLS